jgi:hypothetical protein
MTRFAGCCSYDQRSLDPHQSLTWTDPRPEAAIEAGHRSKGRWRWFEAGWAAPVLQAAWVVQRRSHRRHVECRHLATRNAIKPQAVQLLV